MVFGYGNFSFLIKGNHQEPVFLGGICGDQNHNTSSDLTDQHQLGPLLDGCSRSWDMIWLLYGNNTVLYGITMEVYIAEYPFTLWL